MVFLETSPLQPGRDHRLFHSSPCARVDLRIYHVRRGVYLSDRDPCEDAVLWRSGRGLAIHDMHHPSAGRYSAVLFLYMTLRAE